MANLQDTPSDGPLTAADLVPFQSWPDSDVEPWYLPHFNATAQRWPAGPRAEMPTSPAPSVVPCSTLARLYLALRNWWRG